MNGPQPPSVIVLGRPAPDLEWALVNILDAPHAAAHGWHIATYLLTSETNAAHSREDTPPPGETGS